MISKRINFNFGKNFHIFRAVFLKTQNYQNDRVLGIRFAIFGAISTLCFEHFFGTSQKTSHVQLGAVNNVR